MTNPNAYDQRIIAEFRARGGPAPGSHVLLLTTTGAKSGLQRTTPVSYLRDGERYIITSSHGGAPTHSAWFHNLLATPQTTIEVGSETLPVTAVVLTGAERDQWFAALAAQVPAFADFQAKTTRRFPMVALEPQQH